MKLLEVADSITAQEVNAVAASVLSYISHYRNEEALLAEAASDYSRNGYAEPGPTRMTSIVACVPAYMDASGQSTGKFYLRAIATFELCNMLTQAGVLAPAVAAVDMRLCGSCSRLEVDHIS